MCPLHFLDKHVSNIPQINPFNSSGCYDSSWVFLKLVNTDAYDHMTGRDRIFGLTVSSRSDVWYYRIMDFIQYQTLYNRSVILLMDEEEYRTAQAMYKGHSINDAFIRSYEPATLVHSAPWDSYVKIMEDGSLKSWNQLKMEQRMDEDAPIGYCLGDPPDFSNFVMLGGGVSPEIVVSSKQKGFICMEQDCEYQPGARFYFDIARLTQSGLLIRDGAHLKVQDKLSISHCDFIVTKDDIKEHACKITPTFFAELADALYANYRANNAVCTSL